MITLHHCLYSRCVHMDIAVYMYMYSGTSLIRTLWNKDTSIIRTLCGYIHVHTFWICRYTCNCIHNTKSIIVASLASLCFLLVSLLHWNKWCIWETILNVLKVQYYSLLQSTTVYYSETSLLWAPLGWDSSKCLDFLFQR